MQVSGTMESVAIQRDFFLFFAYAATYFVVNSMAVSGVVATQYVNGPSAMFGT